MQAPLPIYLWMVLITKKYLGSTVRIFILFPCVKYFESAVLVLKAKRCHFKPGHAQYMR